VSGFKSGVAKPCLQARFPNRGHHLTLANPRFPHRLPFSLQVPNATHNARAPRKKIFFHNKSLHQ
jgi:hypothetical protein